jgi:hypothetical protein
MTLMVWATSLGDSGRCRQGCWREEENDSMFLYYDFKAVEGCLSFGSFFHGEYSRNCFSSARMNDDLAKDDHGGFVHGQWSV